MKICSCCKKNLPLSCFSKNKRRSDGHCNRCKACEKNRSRLHRLKNQANVKKYYKNVVKKTRSREKEREWNARWREKNKHKMKAHKILRKALINAEIDQEQCKICKNEDTVAHHDNYSKPLDIDWLCVDCHGFWHQVLNEWERQGHVSAYVE